MLILWRSSGQTLIVGESVEIQVLDTRHNRVKLGIVAPDSVSIVRGETRMTREENRAAALSAGHDVIETLLRRLPQDVSRPRREAGTIGVKKLTAETAGLANKGKKP